MLNKCVKASGLQALALVSLASRTQALDLDLGTSMGMPGDNATYDYVVVGGGNAGLTIAMRLVEQKAGTVAIVEAGSFYELTNSNISSLPATDSVFSGKGADDWQPSIDWGYMTTPQAGAYNTSLHYARGKTLGGCSARNFMVYQRGTKGSYQQWADMVGDESYTWDNFLPYFKKSVNFTKPNMNLRFANSTPGYDAEDAGDANGGPLSVTFSNSVLAIGTWASKGFEQIGLPGINGFLSGSLIGHAFTTSTIDAQKMTRDSSETSFLRVGLEMPDLTLYTTTTAKKVMFDGNKTATGVMVEVTDDETDDGRKEFLLSARKEVILSAGVFGSPHLLLVSGVGPAKDLQALSIPVVADRPGVGQGMQDHVMSGIAYRVNGLTMSALQNPEFAAEQAGMFHQQPPIGMYTNPNTEVLAWEKIPDALRSGWSEETNNTLAAYPADWPEAEYISIPSYLGNQVDSRDHGPKDGFNYATAVFVLITPISRGTLTINSPDFNVAPNINPNFLTAQADVDVMVGAFKRIREYYATDAMKQFVIGDEFFPGQNVTTDEDIVRFVRTSFNTIWHATSTTAMGRLNDTMAVVDSKSRVIGVNNLRVVDAAAFPLLPPGHPMSTVYAFAEKIACDISGKC